MKKTILFSGLFGIILGAGLFTFVLTNAQNRSPEPLAQQTCQCRGDQTKCTCGADCGCASCGSKSGSCHQQGTGSCSATTGSISCGCKK